LNVRFSEFLFVFLFNKMSFIYRCVYIFMFFYLEALLNNMTNSNTFFVETSNRMSKCILP